LGESLKRNGLTSQTNVVEHGWLSKGKKNLLHDLKIKRHFLKKSYEPKNVSIHYYLKVHIQILPKFCHFQDFQIFLEVFYVTKILATLF